jgi:hypothetical protein
MSGNFASNLDVSQNELQSDLMTLGQAEVNLLNTIMQEASNNDLDVSDITQDLSAVVLARMDLYGLLGSALKTDYNSLLATNPVLSSQADTLNLLEDEILSTEEKLELAKQENINKLRLIEINEYYGSLYEDQAWLMKIIVIMCVHISVLCILYKVLKFPENIFFMCLGGTLVVGSYYFITRAVNIASRDNMNYDQYNIPFTPPKNSDVVPANATPANPWYAENNVSSVDCSCNSTDSS